MCAMESIDFTQVPGFGAVMQLTGIADGWVLVAALFLLLALVFLIGWLHSSSKGRAARRELAQVREELVGAQALVNLPPLHEGDYDYLNGDDPGSSLVFASARELRRRHSAAEAPAVEPTPQPQPQEQPAAPQEPPAPAAEPAPNVTAQVHEAIYASVTGSKLHAQAEEQPASQDAVGTRRRKPNGAAITSSDLPPIKLEGGQARPVAQAPLPKRPAADPDASLSSRIPKL
ncbi:MAG: hypothetical protein ACI36Y_07650 [Coriobacteriales bacterium]